MRWDSFVWKQVILNDEKLNSDGPDTLSWYWKDLRKDAEMFSTKQHGGSKIMVWSALCYQGTGT